MLSGRSTYLQSISVYFFDTALIAMHPGTEIHLNAHP